MQQLDLLLPAPLPGYARHSDTSLDAAKAVANTVTERQRRVLDVLRQRGPSTGEEVAKHLREQCYRVLPRITELSERGLVARTGERRANDSGATAWVWAISASTSGSTSDTRTMLVGHGNGDRRALS